MSSGLNTRTGFGKRIGRPRAGRPVVAALFAICISLLTAATTAAAAWKPATSLGDQSALGGEPAFGPTGASAGVVLYASHDSSAGFDRVFARQTGDGGVSWSSASPISGTTSEAGYPAVATNGLSVYAAWIDGYGVKYRRSADGGATWSDEVSISDWHKQLNPSIAVLNGNVAIVWAEWDTGNVQARISSDDGATWAPTETIGATNAQSRARVAYSPAGLFVAYWASAKVIEFTRSLDAGTTWQTPIILAKAGQGSQAVSIAANGADVVVAFGGSQPRLRHSGNAGTSFDRTTYLATNYAGGTALQFADGKFELAYGLCCSAGDFYRTSPDGASWSSPLKVTKTGTITDVSSSAGHALVFYEAGAYTRATVRRQPWDVASNVSESRVTSWPRQADGDREMGLRAVAAI